MMVSTAMSFTVEQVGSIVEIIGEIFQDVGDAAYVDTEIRAPTIPDFIK
jgi:hypothetical protein